MIEALRWLLVLEVLGLAFLPLSTWLFRFLPDRGYAFAKLLGLLLVTYGAWLLGSFLPTGTIVAIPVLIILLVAGIGWWRGGAMAAASLRDARVAIGIEEALFLAAFIVWSLLRVYDFHSAISHTEQYMDLMLLTTSLQSPSYPPLDLWMSGHTVNYYYIGYLMWANVTRLSGVPAAVGYNLALSSLFALVISGLYSLGWNLTRRFSWALLAPLFVALLGNWHAILVQLPAGHLPSPTNWWFFESTRVVDGWNTINEFPFFSFMLGDLHPHVMALPVTLLAIALGLNALRGPAGIFAPGWASRGRLLLIALCVGALFTINSWDFPTFLLLIALCIGAAGYTWDATPSWWKLPLTIAITLGIGSTLLYLPFYLHFRSLAHGIGPVIGRTAPGQFLQVFGLFLAGVFLLLGSLALLLQPAEEIEESDNMPAMIAGERGSMPISTALNSSYGLFLVALLALAVGVVLHALVFVLLVLVAGGALLVLERVLNTEEPNLSDTAALLCVLVACMILGFTEVFYLRDSFDGGPSYRMNTIFKFYYEAWTLLGVVAAYGLWRGREILQRFIPALPVWIIVGALAVGVAGAGAYTVLAPTSGIQPAYGATSLNGMTWLRSAQPGDYAAIEWLRHHVSGRPVELEAVGPDYQSMSARISTFSGLPTVMGWAGHEEQWRPNDGDVGQRTADVQTIYTTPSVPTAERLLRQYHVRYVIVGDTELQTYKSPAGFAKFKRFMRVAFQADGTIIFTW